MRMSQKFRQTAGTVHGTCLLSPASQLGATLDPPNRAMILCCLPTTLPLQSVIRRVRRLLLAIVLKCCTGSEDVRKMYGNMIGLTMKLIQERGMPLTDSSIQLPQPLNH